MQVFEMLVKTTGQKTEDAGEATSSEEGWKTVKSNKSSAKENAMGVDGIQVGSWGFARQA